ncbi:alpha/beta fold hydrolase [Nocardia terpenica]|uniref:alpha/beta hydrolase family protein n=1 Tax=Nocardia terpenica TaxID=455432 RepID=UPI001895CE24|nr:alpha/beta fold hydrolase [Nocardia terpenica]MBF6065184.1 alpha/beta fold hydrolase [Nocardia terpenica]MBF6107911.1 alpha/beta fold hydrolase [Nocardia terpenica]MBF6115558.1 alpha/beta fold hydrolase [Nocardia terpenica]MBF6121995.1 alpha/beta fold hydrolase [Nocardia terpenica]MBF6155461.1 alpha/beta fold hydrolase [Nocardia terpenica]
MPAPTPSAVPALTTPIVSVKPIVLAAPRRGDDLQVRLSAPVVGTGLPVVVFAHGFGQSMASYDPLVDFWAGSGFVVIQPTFLDSQTLGITPADPRYPDIWRYRVRDVERVLDELDLIVAAIPGLGDRIDRDRIAVAGHSWGAQTVGILLGARVVGADGQPGPDKTDPRVKAGVLLAATGIGGDDLTPFATENFPFMSPHFDGLTTPTLVIAGDRDQSALSTRGPDWFTDVYTYSPGAQSLLTVFGAEHSLGGIHAYRATDTTDESPERVAVIREASWAYLRTALGIDDTAWKQLQSELAQTANPAGRIDNK